MTPETRTRLDPDALARLLERVEGAKGADREIDWEFRKTFLPEQVPYVLARYEESKAECKRNGLWPARKGACWRDAMYATGRYTASLDAIIGLTQKLGFQLYAWEDGRWFLRLPLGRGARQFGGPRHNDMTLALCAALIRAMLAKERILVRSKLV